MDNKLSQSFFQQPSLCKLLNISDIYSEYYGSNPNNLLSFLNENGKSKAIEYINLLIDSRKFNVPNDNVIEFKKKAKLYDIPISAGTGNFLDSDSYTEIEIDSAIATIVDYGVRISDNSMEPRFLNGQVVWVKKQDKLLSGETGIFCINGDTYCKIFQNDANGIYLISMNKKYAPIPVSENSTFKILGKVIL